MSSAFVATSFALVGLFAGVMVNASHRYHPHHEHHHGYHHIDAVQNPFGTLAGNPQVVAGPNAYLHSTGRLMAPVVLIHQVHVQVYVVGHLFTIQARARQHSTDLQRFSPRWRDSPGCP